MDGKPATEMLSVLAGSKFIGSWQLAHLPVPAVSSLSKYLRAEYVCPRPVMSNSDSMDA